MSESPRIVRFSAEPASIQPGQCATLRWRVQGVKAVYVFQEGERWKEHGVVGEGERQVCPPETTTYCLRVINRDDSAEVRKLVVEVGMPASQKFSVDRTEVRPGECATFRWRVEGVRAVYFYAEGERWKQHGVVGEGEQQVCPSQSTTYCLRVIKSDDSVEEHKIAVHVGTEPGGPLFTADRTTVRPGECATFRWRVQDVKAVYFYPEEQRWQDHGVVGEGEKQVCPSQATTYCLRVIKSDDSVEIQSITVHVRS